MAKVSCLPIRVPPIGTRTARWTDSAAQQPLLAIQPSPRKGGAMIVVGRGSTGSSRAVNGQAADQRPHRGVGGDLIRNVVAHAVHRAVGGDRDVHDHGHRAGGRESPPSGSCRGGVGLPRPDASPSRRSSVSPSGAATAIDVRVTGAANPLVTSRSYSRWSTPSLPETRRGSFVAETTMAVVVSTAVGEASGRGVLGPSAPGEAWR